MKIVQSFVEQIFLYARYCSRCIFNQPINTACIVLYCLAMIYTFIEDISARDCGLSLFCRELQTAKCFEL